MTSPANTWEAADKAYQLHHSQCPQCRAAGVAPGRQERCPEGIALWKTYLDAGDPPHFTWLRSLQKRQGRRT